MKTRFLPLFLVLFGLWANFATAQVSLRGVYTNGAQASLPVLFAVRDNNTVNCFIFDSAQKKLGRVDGPIAADGSFNLANVAGYTVVGTLTSTGYSATPSIAATMTSATGSPLSIAAPRTALFGLNGEDLIAGRFEGLAVNQTKSGKSDLLIFVDTDNDIYWIHSVAGALDGGVGTVVPNPTVAGNLFSLATLTTGGDFSLTTVSGASVSGSFTTNTNVMTGTFSYAGASWNFDAFRVAAGNRFGNISARAMVGTGNNILIEGFVIFGGPKLVLIRGIGPGLQQFGITNYLAHPQLNLFKGQSIIASNSGGWQTAANSAEIVATRFAPYVKADAGILVMLEAGIYTVQASGADGGTGICLVDIYEVSLE